MSGTTNGAPAEGDGKWVGQRVRRREDPPLITGRGRYTDDITLPGQLWASLVRSPIAHARIASIDTSAAQSAPGVTAVFTGEDLAADFESPLPMAWVPPGIEINTPEHWPLARGEVKHVGDAVAIVVGEDRYKVADAAELVEVEYDELPVVVDTEAALQDGSPLVHEGFGTNVSHTWSLGTEPDALEAAFQQADVVVEQRIVNHRSAPAPIEPRSVLADYRAGDLVVYSATQIPHFLRLFLSLALGMTEDKIRVIAPDVGGGFGGKLQIYPEEYLCCALTRRLNRPVKWTETRSEHMQVTHHGRDQVDYMRVGAKSDGTIVALHSKILSDMGAYLMLLTPLVPELGAFVMSGCYAIPAVRCDVTGVFTNKTPTDAVRGAGRPEATHMIEVTLDRLARELGIDRLELRRRNFIPKESFPHEVAVGVTYDSGDYHGTLDKLLTTVDEQAIKAEAPEGRVRGVGYSTYTEICGLAPSRIVGPSGLGLQAGLWESALVRVHITGGVTVYTGTSPHGQGIDTTFAQIVADRLGISPELVEVVHGDTGAGPQGLNTYGSRSLAVGGEAVVRATDKVVHKIKQVVANALEASPDDIELTGDTFAMRGSPDKGMTLAEAAGAAYIAESIPEDMEPGLEETAFYDPQNFVFPFGAHACVVDLDPETGRVDVVRYVAVDDCGPAINPMIIDGQIHGGIVHGLGQALYERIHFDENGNLVTGTFVDYALPSAAEVPSFETDRTETPSPVNALGVKGVGEAGTIAASAAVTNAVIDALRQVGVDYIDMPLSPLRVWEAIQQAKGGVAA
jgi:aerobic carbon-monoxide dehydrogenase large subunit